MVMTSDEIWMRAVTEMISKIVNVVCKQKNNVPNYVNDDSSMKYHNSHQSFLRNAMKVLSRSTVNKLVVRP